MTLTELEQRTQLKRETLKYIEENKFINLPKWITLKVLLDVMQV